MVGELGRAGGRAVGGARRGGGMEGGVNDWTIECDLMIVFGVDWLMIN